MYTINGQVLKSIKIDQLFTPEYNLKTLQCGTSNCNYIKLDHSFFIHVQDMLILKDNTLTSLYFSPSIYHYVLYGPFFVDEQAPL